MNNIGVIICNYNKVKDLDLCLTSIIESTCFNDIELYVVDNASSDSSVALIQKKYADCVTLIQNETNLGGSGGFNSGLRVAMQKNYEYLMCIDNDAIIDENCIANLRTFLDEHQECGMACAKVFYTENPDIIQQYGITIDYKNYCVTSKYDGTFEDGSLPDYLYCDALPACALLVRRSVIDIIGLLPEENFLYWDDTEWCTRCQLAGYRIACVGNAEALHSMGAKKENETTFPTYYAWRNWLRFFMIHTPKEQLQTMCQSMLTFLYEDIYEAIYNNEPIKVKTLMAAFDDALHNVNGMACDGIIGNCQRDSSRLKQILSKYPSILIISNGFERESFTLKSRLLALSQQENLIKIDADIPHDITIQMCDSIFTQEDLSCSVIYADCNGNILLNEEDVYYILNYQYGLHTFIETNLQLFLRKTEELRTILNLS